MLYPSDLRPADRAMLDLAATGPIIAMRGRWRHRARLRPLADRPLARLIGAGLLDCSVLVTEGALPAPSYAVLRLTAAGRELRRRSLGAEIRARRAARLA